MMISYLGSPPLSYSLYIKELKEVLSLRIEASRATLNSGCNAIENTNSHPYSSYIVSTTNFNMVLALTVPNSKTWRNTPR